MHSNLSFVIACVFSFVGGVVSTTMVFYLASRAEDYLRGVK